MKIGTGVSAKDKATWVNSRDSDIPSRGVETLDVTVSCDVIYWHWSMQSIGSGHFPVKGFGRFEVSRSGQDSNSIQVGRVDSEFDSISWGLNERIQSCTYEDGTTVAGNSTGF